MKYFLSLSNRFIKSVIIFLLLFTFVTSLAYAGVDLVTNNSDSPDPVAAGGIVTYTIEIANNGDTDSPTTGLTVTIPAAATYFNDSSTDGVVCSESGVNELTCDFGSLLGNPINQVKTVQIELQTQTQGLITLGAVATTSGAGADDNAADNTATQDTTVNQGANVALVKSASAASVPSGSTLSYNLAITNNGPNAASSLRIEDTVPAGFSLTSLPTGCNNSAGTVICDIDGSIAAGDTVNVGSITGIITSASASTITNAASVDLQPSAPVGTAQDPDTSDNTSTVDTTVTAGSDVKIAKSRSIGGSLLVGTDFDFTLSPSYSGDSPQNLTVTDSIPANYTINSGAFLTSQNGWSCSLSDQDVICTRASGGASGVYNQAIGDIVIPVTVASSGNNVINSATVMTDSTDSDLSNNSATDGGANLLDPTVDLGIDKAGPSPALVVTGIPFDFNVNVNNTGTTGFYGTARVTDIIPDNMTVNSYNLNGWDSCLPAAPVIGPATITCERTYTSGAPLAAGATSSSIVMTAETATDGVFTNNATITTPDCNAGNLATCNDGDTDSYTVTSSVTADSADVSILKSVDSATVPAGDILTYTLEVINDNPAYPTTSTNVRLTDIFSTLINDSFGALEAAYIDEVLVAGLATGGTCSNSSAGANARQLTCTFDTVPVCTQGVNCPVVTVRVRPGGDGGSRTNTANVVSNGTADPNHSNDSDSVTSTVEARADVTPTKTATPVTVPSGQNLTYVVTAQNNGPSRADAVVMTDSLPLDVTFISAAPSSGICATTPVANITTTGGNRTVACHLGNIDNGAQQTVTIVVRPNIATLGLDPITNNVSLTTSTIEITGDETNDAAVNTDISNPALDLVINKTDTLAPGIDPIAVGDDAVYTIRVDNSGPSAAENVVVTDSLPGSNLSFLSVSGASCSLIPAIGSFGGTLTCELGYLIAGSSTSFTVVMRGEAKGFVNNVASVTSTETIQDFDTIPANNSVTEGTTVRTKADMEVVSKLPSTDPVNLRDDFDFTIKVRNNVGVGLAEADDVEISDSLPAGMELTGTPTVAAPSSGSITASTCTGVAGGTSFTCSLGTVATDTEVDITVPVQLISVISMPQTFSNTASVTTSSLDTIPGNNSNSGTVAVNSSSLSGQVFRDFNGDGAVTAGDTGISAVTMTLTGTSFDGIAVTRTVTTDASGNYIFPGLPESDGTGYTISEGAVSESHLNDGAETAGTAGGDDTTVNDEISGAVLSADSAVTGYLFAEVPIARIGVAKQVLSGPTIQGDGTFVTTFRLMVENFSLEQMNSIAVNDSLTGVAPAFGTFVSGGAAATLNNGDYTIQVAPSGSCGGSNTSFNGNGDTTVATIPTLADGTTCSLDFTVRAMPTAPLPAVQPSGGRYENQADISATGDLSGQVVTDISDNGTNPDPDGNGTAGDAGESDPTPVSPVYGPAIGIAKTVQGAISVAADGSIIVPIRLVVENVGNEPVNTVSVTDSLAGVTPNFGTHIAGGAGAALSSGQYTIQTTPSGSCGGLNTDFDGSSDNELAAFAALPIGNSCNIDFTYRFMPLVSSFYQNQASISATGDHSGTGTSDSSDHGTDPDPNNNDDPTEAGENDPTPIPYPRVGLAKQVVGGSTTNADGTVTIPFSLVVQNLGGEILTGITITDDLSGVAPQFGNYVAGGAGATLVVNEYTIETALAFDGLCANGTLNPAYDGDGNQALATISSLAINNSCTTTFSLRFRPGAPLPAGGNFVNQAEATGTGADSGIVTTDLSDDGVTPDIDGDGIANETGENDLTLVTVTFTPQIALAKALSAAETINADGTVTVPFRLQVSNTGTEPLLAITVSDVLTGSAPLFGSYVAGGAAANLNNGEYTVQVVPVFNGSCLAGSLSGGYDGNIQNQLASLTRLEIAESCEIDFSLRFKPTSPLPAGGYSNQGSTQGTGELSGGDPVIDLSQNGTNPDPDSNNDPTNDNDPTPVNPTHTAAIGIAKSLNTGLIVNADNSYMGTFRLQIENLGNEELLNVSVTDSMNIAPANLGSYVSGGAAATLSAGQYTIETAPVFIGSCANGATNPLFDGEVAPQIASVTELGTNSSCTLEYGFRFVPQPGISYFNQAITQGTGAFSGDLIDDLSDDGVSPDTDGDMVGNEVGENDPTSLPIPRIGIAKSVGTISNNGDGTYDVPFTLTITNAGETSLNNIQIRDELSEFGAYIASSDPAAGQYTISSDPVVTNQSNGAVPTPVAAGIFTGEGAGESLLVALSSTLPSFGGSASTAEILFTVKFFPITEGPFNNSAVASGTSPAGGDVTDDSISGSIPDADGNGDPGDDSSPTVVNLSGQVIGVSKAVGGILQTGIKSYEIPYSLIIVNPSSSVTATNVQLSDNLSTTFPTAQSISISTPATVFACSGTTLNTASPVYNGTTQSQLLTGNQNLQPGEQCTVTFTASVDFGTNPLPATIQNNTAIATTAETSGGIQITSDLSDDGVVPDTDGNGNASDPGENDPTSVDFSGGSLSSVSGKIWLDSNHDQIDNDGSTETLPTFIVEILNSSGTIVGATTADDAGNYTVGNLFPSTTGDSSTYYSVRFRESASGAIYGSPLSQDPVNPNGTVVDGIISSLQLASGVNTINQDLPLDPSGVVYDSVTRMPVAGATVFFTGPAGFDPALHLVGGSANQTQVTGSSGFYQYILLPGAPVGTYSLDVTPPAGYVPGASTLVPVCENTPFVGATPDPALVQDNSVPPTLSSAAHDAATCPGTSGGFSAGASSTQYYSSFDLTPGVSGDVVNNHFPVDPVLGGAITLVKTSPLVNVSVGQLVPYTITATNTLAAVLTNIDIRDLLPPGFKYMSGSASLDGISAIPAISGRLLSWTDLSFSANATRTVKLLLVVGAGVQPGEYINTAQAFNNLVPATDNTVSNRATAAVRVIPDPVFDCSDVIGKVFDDQNANGYQDDGEPGLPNVRVATARGLLVTTDVEGRYHVTCAMVPNEFRGSNFIMKLDERTLPSGYRITTENPRVIYLTRGKMGKLNFGAAIHRVIRLEMTDAAFITDQNEPGQGLSQAIINLPEQLRVAPSVIRLAYNQKNNAKGLINSRLKEVRNQIEKLWEEQGCCYTLVFEEEVFQRALQNEGGNK